MLNYARKHGDHDLYRLGIFIEMPYIPHEKDPVLKKSTKKKKAVVPFYVGCNHPISDTLDGYFETEFKRIFEEPYFKKKDRKKIKEKSKAERVFIPAGPGKIHSTPNDFYGCFVKEGEWPEHLSPELKKEFKKKIGPGQKATIKHAKPNPLTNPGKLGGPGYVDITISSYPEHSREPPPKALKKSDYLKSRKKVTKPPLYAPKYPSLFDENAFRYESKGLIYVRPKEDFKKKKSKTPFVPTGPGKKDGGCFAGGFNAWPEHSMEPPKKIDKTKIKKKTASRYFIPNYTCVKSMQQRSILENLNFSLNAMNYKNFTPTYLTYL